MTAHTTIILGAGKTGRSIVDYLQNELTHCILMDSRDNPPELPSIQTAYPHLDCRCGPFEADALLTAKRIIVSPGVSLDIPAIRQAMAHNIPIYSDIDLFLQKNKTPLIAITGSNGKTTVTHWVGEALSALGLNPIVCGNIGIPVLSLDAHNAADFIVMELSSFQLAASQTLNATAAVCLNVSPDHLDRHGSLESYKKAKMRIYKGAKHVIVNHSPTAGYQWETHNDKRAGFSLEYNRNAEFTVSDNQLCYRAQPVHCIKAWRALGDTHCHNALAVLTIMDALGLNWQSILPLIPTFAAPPHRQQYIATIEGVRYINDSKATNIGAADAALLAMAGAKPHSLIWLAGGQSKAAPLEQLKKTVAHTSRCAIFFGEDAAKFEQTFSEICTTERVDTLEQAVVLASQHAQSGETVLLAPAAASLDQFTNFEERGHTFVQSVKGLTSK